MSIRADTARGAYEINDEEQGVDGFRHLLMTLDIEDVDGLMDVIVHRLQFEHGLTGDDLSKGLAVAIDSFTAGVRTDQLTLIEVTQLQGL